jgi:ribonuclease P/MRP protein subunit RPP40
MYAIKLSSFGIVDKARQWIRHFLLNRTFNVKVGGYVSRTAKVTSGVPQGSVLGPLLFLLFINDLTIELSNPCFIFADDVKIAGAGIERDLDTVCRLSLIHI